jgi:hypothetical protein
MLEDDHHGPALAAQWFLQYLAYQPDACSFSAATLSDLLGGCGFVDISSQVLIAELTKIVLGKKPL